MKELSDEQAKEILASRKAKMARAHKKYRQTEKGKAVVERHRRSEKRRASNEKYRQLKNAGPPTRDIIKLRKERRQTGNTGSLRRGGPPTIKQERAGKRHFPQRINQDDQRTLKQVGF